MTVLDSPHVWNASDLARERRSILAEAELGTALVRGPAGELLVMTTARRVQALETLPQAAAVLAASVALFEETPRISELGELGFAAEWPADRRALLARDVRDVVVHAIATRNPAEITVFLEASRPREASGPVDPARIAALLGD